MKLMKMFVLLLYFGVVLTSAALAAEEVEYDITVPDYIDVERNITISNILSYSDVTNAYDAAPWDMYWGEKRVPYKWNVTTENGELTIGFERYEIISTSSQDITFFRTVTEQKGSHTETRYREVRPVQTARIAGMSAGTQAAGWWNNAWQYKIDNLLPDGARPYQLSLTLSNSAGTNTETQVFLSGHAKPDFSDVRFTLNDAIELPYWIESAATGKVWVNVPDNGTVNIYYGNPSASDLSNGKNTFEFFDDFTTLDLGANPVIAPSQTWEIGPGLYLRWGSIAYLNGIYYMYYTNGASSTSDIGRASSTDLITWDKYAGNPVINDRIGPSLLKELDGKTPKVYNNKYWMLTMKSDGSAIELRSSSTLDGNWTIENSSLIPRTPGTWHANYLYTTSFVHENGKYYIVMESGPLGGPWKIGYFEAPTPSGAYIDKGILLSPSEPWEVNGVLDPEMRKFGSTYYLFYTGHETFPYQNSYASNIAGLGDTYQKSNIIVTPDGQSYPAILQKDSYFYILVDDQPSKYPGKSLWRRKDLNGPFGSPFEWNRGGTPTVSGSELLINSNGEFVRSSSSFLYKAMKIRAKYAPQTAANSFQYFGFVPSSAADETPSEMFFSRETPANTIEAWSGNSISSENTIISNPAYFGSYHNYEILWRQNETKFIIDDALKATQTTSVANISMPAGIYDYNTGADLAVEWVFVRNYVSPEPAWSVWGTEEAQNGDTLLITGLPDSPVTNNVGDSRTFSITANQVVDVAWYLNGTLLQSNTSVKDAVYTNTSAPQGTWIVNVTATNVNGVVSKEWTWIVNTPSSPGAPSITGFPVSPVNNNAGDSRIFSITANQTVNVTWYINGTQVQFNDSVTGAVYTNTSAAQGTWIVNATATNVNGSASKEWIWIVDATPLIINIISPGNDSENFNGNVNVTVNLNRTGTALLNWNGVNESMDGGTTSFYKNKAGLLSGVFRFRVYATDSAGNANVSETRILTVNRTKPVTLTNTSTIEIISPSSNVTVTVLNGTNASVGGTSLTSISIDSLAQVNPAFIVNLSSNDRLIGENLFLGPEGATFRPDIQIRFNYSDSQLTAAGVSEPDLTVKYYNTTTNNWESLTIYERNTTGNYLIVNTSHFSTFAMLGTITPLPVATSSPSSSGGGGGGGGGGMSGENSLNIEVIEKYDLQISRDVTTSYRFTHQKNPIMFVNITGKTSLGIITTSLEVLKNTSTLVNIPPEGLVYKNANIWVGTSGFATPKNIKEAVISFRVKTSWITENDLAPDDIKLLRWNGKEWVRLETSEIGKDSTYNYFEAKTNSFSPFAITGIEKNIPSLAAVTSVPTETAKAVKESRPEGKKPEPTNRWYYIFGGLLIIGVIKFGFHNKNKK